MKDYKAVRSSLDISKSIVSLELSQPAMLHPQNRAKRIREVNDIIQGRSKQAVESVLAVLAEKAGDCHADEIAGLQQDILDFQQQKARLSRAYYKSSCSMVYKYEMLKGSAGKPLKIVNQKLFDQAVEHGFPPDFFRQTYFDQVTIYCLPANTDFSNSMFQNCTFAVCRISAPSFIGARIYDSEFHSCVLDHADLRAASLAHTHFHDCTLNYVTFEKAHLKSCNFIDCILSHINYLTAELDGCSFGRVTASHIHHLDTAVITQGGSTDEECRHNREAIFHALRGE